MYIKLIVLVLTFLSLVNCSESEGELFANRRSSTVTGAGAVGSDENAKIGLDIAKDFLSKMILNSDDSMFTEFPDSLKKAEIVEIIKGLSFSNDERSRDGEALLFDYDLENKKLFYTKAFVSKYGQYRFSSSAENDLKKIKEYSLLMLDELSHIMGIGKTKEKQTISQFFANSLLYHMLTETKICEGLQNSTPFSLVINPQTGMSYFVNGKTAEDFTGANAYQIKENIFATNSLWNLGAVFPFFDLKGDEASNASQIAVAELIPEYGVQSSSPYYLIEFLKAPDVTKNNLMFWNFKDGNSADYSYKITNQIAGDELPGTNQTTPEANAGVRQIEEIGLIQINTTTTDQSGLSIDVKLNGQIDPNQSFNQPLNCKHFVSPYKLQDIIELNASSEQDVNIIQTKLNEIFEKMTLLNN